MPRRVRVLRNPVKWCTHGMGSIKLIRIGPTFDFKDFMDFTVFRLSVYPRTMLALFAILGYNSRTLLLRV